MYIAMSMSMTYIQLIQQCTLAIWGGGVTLNFYPAEQSSCFSQPVSQITHSHFRVSHFADYPCPVIDSCAYKVMRQLLKAFHILSWEEAPFHNCCRPFFDVYHNRKPYFPRFLEITTAIKNTGRSTMPQLPANS